MPRGRAHGAAEWPRAGLLELVRLRLEPLSVAHAPEMVSVLGSDQLYAFTGGEPPSERELRTRYARQAGGQSPDGEQGWANWIIRERTSGRAAGFVQATIDRRARPGAGSADIAWVVAPAFQGRGFASEAAAAVLCWLEGEGVSQFRAMIHPENQASIAVAHHLGFSPSAELIDGERVWLRDRAATTATE